MQQAKLDNQLCFEVYRAANQFTKLYAKALQPFQLTYPQYLVLLILWDEDEQTSSAIGQRLGLGIGTLNPVLKKLIEKGWLTKAPCCKDRRASILSLTDQAKRAQGDIEQQVISTLFCTDYLHQYGPPLKAQLHDLNTFLTMMNREES